MPEKLVDRNHMVSSESWDGVHWKHYPMHRTPFLGWRYYPSRTNQERVVWFTFEDAAIRHLQGRIERGE